MPSDDITALAEIVLGWRDPDLGITVTVLLSDKLHSVKPVKTLCCFDLHVIMFVCVVVGTEFSMANCCGFIP